jgi:hypothetical protein
LQCGFAAPALDSTRFTSFQPFFVPRTSAFPCFCNQPYSIEPFFDFDQSPAKNFADAVGEAFGGKFSLVAVHGSAGGDAMHPYFAQNCAALARRSEVTLAWFPYNA